MPSTLVGRSLVAAVAALLPYLLLPGKPLLYDAPMAILANPAVQSEPLTRLATVDFWGMPAGADYGSGSYRPLVSLTWAAQARTAGNSPFLYHTTDMLLHALAAASVVWLLTRLGLAGGASLTGGLLFAVHPVQSEAVASAVGRADLMAALSLLTALALHIGAPASRRPLLRHAGALLALAAGFLCKEYAVSFPFIVVAADLAWRFAGRSRPGTERQERAFWACAFLLLGAYLLLRYSLFGALGDVPMLEGADHPLWGKPPLVRWSTAAALFALACRLAVLPYALNHHYRFGTLPIAESPSDPRAICGLLLLGGLLLGGAWCLRRLRDPIPLIAVVLFCLPLLPSLNTVSLAGVLFAERLLYLPLAGLALGAGWAGGRWAAAGRLPRYGKPVLAAVLLLFGGLAARRVEAWDSEETLARSSLASYPGGSEVWEHLGAGLGAQGRHEEAVETYERSLAINPDHPRSWKHYADTLMALGRYDDAARAWRRALDLSPPDLGLLWRGFGEAELRAGRGEQAARALARAHELMPADPKSLYYLALAHLKAEDPAGAVSVLRSGQQAMANDPEALRVLLGQALLRLGQLRLEEGGNTSAAALAQEAVQLGVLPPDGLFLAGLLARRSGETELARRWFALALERDADLLLRKQQLAAKLRHNGRYEDAAGLLLEILEAEPARASALFDLGGVLLAAGKPKEAVATLRRGLDLQEDARARELLAQAIQEGQR